MTHLNFNVKARYQLRHRLLFVISLLFASIFYFSNLESNDLRVVSEVLAATNGDCNNDGRVDILDFQLLSNSFGKSQGQTGYNANCDSNTDGRVDILDFQILSNNFGRTTTVTPTRTVTSTPTPRLSVTPPPPPPPSTGLFDCRGYPEPRVFLESQAWWWTRLSTQTGDDFGHIHFGTCFPHGQVVSGDIRFKVRLVMHENPGRINNVHTWENIANVNLTCPTNVPECVWWFERTMPLSSLGGSGRNEVRFHTHMSQPDGNQLFPTTGWQLYINSRTGSENDYFPFVKNALAAPGRSSDVIIARGWYTGSEYQNATLVRANIFTTNTSDLRSQLLSYIDSSGQVQGKVRGVWRPVVSAAPGSGGSPTDHHMVMIDPNFHGTPPSNGLVVKEGSGSINNYQLTVDTTRLTNGWHKMVIRSDADDRGLCTRSGGAPCDSTLSGVLAVFFYVEN